MAVSDSNIEALREPLESLGAIGVRRMFGGAGIYCDGLMFALIADDILYFKADEVTRADFEAEGLAPFSFSTKGGRRTITSYWRAPERLIDEPEEMLDWSRKAFAAARRSAVRRNKRAKTTRRR